MISKKIIKEGLLIGLLALFFNFINVRICPIYNITHIPCPGCGLTRSVVSILQFKFKQSIEYNILGIPLFIGFIIVILSFIFKKEYILNNFINKHKKILIILSVILLIIVEYINIHNHLLFE